jgi:N-carbamoylputrescine amidase
MKTLKVSVAQITCHDGNVKYNLSHAYEMASEANKKGAELLLFPEFMSQGYRLTEEIWNSAEPFDGATTRWLCETARQFNMYIGSSFLESLTGHFLNTFVLAGPSGEIAGTVRKRYPSMWEAYFFKGYSGDHTFETDFGRVGVGICFDNHTHKVASLIAKGKPDIVLMPHSYCTPTNPNKLSTTEDIERLKNLPLMVARLYNGFLGVPVIMCNKSGSWDSPVPNKILGIPKDFKFSGKSAIIDADGVTVTELNDQEAIGFGQVNLNPGMRKNDIIPKHSRYLYPGPIGREIIRLIELQGYLKYSFSRKRQRKASSVVDQSINE